MSTILFKLKSVPEDEANDVRQLLDDNDIEFYETAAGNWGISMPAIWLKQDQQVPLAKELLKTYQEDRCLQAKKRYQEDKEMGNTTSLFDVFKQEPFRVTLYFAIIVLVLYVSTKIVIELSIR